MAIGGGMKLQEKEAESDDSNMMKIQRFYIFVVKIHRLIILVKFGVSRLVYIY